MLTCPQRVVSLSTWFAAVQPGVAGVTVTLMHQFFFQTKYTAIQHGAAVWRCVHARLLQRLACLIALPAMPTSAAAGPHLCQRYLGELPQQI